MTANKNCFQAIASELTMGNNISIPGSGYLEKRNVIFGEDVVESFILNATYTEGSYFPVFLKTGQTAKLLTSPKSKQ